LEDWDDWEAWDDWDDGKQYQSLSVAEGQYETKNQGPRAKPRGGRLDE